MAGKKLTKKQQAFLDDLFIHPQEPQYVVYQRHYRTNEASARANSARLLSSPEAQAYLGAKQEAAKQRTQIKEDEILQEFWNLASFDLADIFTNNWEVKPIHEIPERARKAITSLAPVAGGGVRITFASRLDALKNLATMLGLNQGKTDNNQDDVLKELFDLIQCKGPTGRPGTLKFDPGIAAQSQFDAD